MRSSKGEGGAHSSSHVFTIHQRLQNALNLGTRFTENYTRRWRCTDIEVQRHVVRSIEAFLETVPRDMLNHPLIKDSLADIVDSLVWILRYKNISISSIAVNVAVKLVGVVPNSMQKHYVLDLAHPLSCLLSSHQIQVAISSASALDLIVSNLTTNCEKRAWEILEKTDIIPDIVKNIYESSRAMEPVEYIQQMLSLLRTILLRWSRTRSQVWSDIKLMKALRDMHAKPDFSFKATVLQLYSAIALCHVGAKKLLEDGKAFIQMMVHYMGSSQPIHVRVEGFRLAQCLAISEDGCLEVINLCCEPIVNAIICAMGEPSLYSKTVSTEKISLLVEACRLALITRWAGEHHIYFWKNKIDRVLLDLLMENRSGQRYNHSLSLEEQINIAQLGIKANHLPGVRLFIWDILGWLAAHCQEDFYPHRHKNSPPVDMLVTYACLASLDTIANWRQICQSDELDASKREPAIRAVMMLAYSPCSNLASKARSVLSEILKPKGMVYLGDLLHTLNSISSGVSFGMSKILISINLMCLTCYLALPQYRKWIIKHGGIKTLLSFVKWCWTNQGYVERLSFSPHLSRGFQKRTCCWASKGDWEGRDTLMVHSLLGLAELIHDLGSLQNIRDIFSKEVPFTEGELVGKLQEICSEYSSTAGLRWYSARILSCFGFYGFPSKLGRRVGKAIDEKEFSDMKLILSNGEAQSVHGVVLAIRCASLLPPNSLPADVKMCDSSLTRDFSHSFRGVQKEVRLSTHVDCEALVKLLEYVYLGYLQAGEELVKKLKGLAKRCNVQPLLHMLCGKRPKWGAPFPSLNLTLALGPAGYHFSDVILEAKATGRQYWSCHTCSLLLPHLHVHKVILWSSCEYLRALLQSGMQDSHSGIIKVPISWEALVKLVDWFYSDKLPNPLSGCLWDTMGTEEKLNELQPYLELCWLAEFWLLENIHENCLRMIVACLDSARHLSVKVIRVAADFSLWKLVEVAANHIAPLYRQLHDSGELEELDEELVNLIRAASVKLSQHGGHQSELV